MATTLQKRGLLILGKRFLNQFSCASGRRAVHASVYDKNPEEYARQEVIKELQSDDKYYWAPHPQTGVFEPPTHHSSGFKFMPAAATADSVLEHKAFFRPLENLDKLPYL